jgi:CMP-N-acetylneuraminic acid synthetase
MGKEGDAVKTYAFVFARGGSKRLPGKNIKNFCGKTLLEHSVSIAKLIPEVSHVFVSTDEFSISEVAQNLGVHTIERPSDLAQDNTPEWLAWRHAVMWAQEHCGPFDRFLSLPTTSPLRIVSDIQKCLDALNEDTDVVITMTESQLSPWFNMVSADHQGFVTLLNSHEDHYTCRQQLPKTFDVTTLAYVCRPHFILNKNSLWEGRVKGVSIPKERAIDIDTELDFKIAEFLKMNFI